MPFVSSNTSHESAPYPRNEREFLPPNLASLPLTINPLHASIGTCQLIRAPSVGITPFGALSRLCRALNRPCHIFSNHFPSSRSLGIKEGCYTSDARFLHMYVVIPRFLLRRHHQAILRCGALISIWIDLWRLLASLTLEIPLNRMKSC